MYARTECLLGFLIYRTGEAVEWGAQRFSTLALAEPGSLDK